MSNILEIWNLVAGYGVQDVIRRFFIHRFGEIVAVIGPNVR